MKTVSIMLVAIAASSCVSLPNDRGVAEVKKLLAERSAVAATSQWNASSACDASRLSNASALTADGSVSIALACSPRMRVIYASMALEQADVFAATRLSNPVVDFARISTGSPDQVVQTTVGITQKFVQLLLLPKQQRLGKDRLRLAQLRLSQAVLDLERDVRAAYVSYASAAAIAAMASQAATTAELSAKTAQEFHAAGNISELQLSREQAAAVEAEIAYRRSEVDATRARAALLSALGIALDRDAALEGAKIASLDLPPALRDEPAVLLKAAQTRLDVQVLRGEVASGPKSLAFARGLLDEMHVGFERERETGETEKRGPTASLAIPIFNSGRDRSLRAHGEREAVHAELSALEINLTNDAWSVLNAARQAHETSRAMRERLVPLRERITALSQREFNFMFIGAFELLAVKREELDAYRSYLESLRDEWLAVLDVQRVAGGAIPTELLAEINEGAKP